LPEEIEPEVVYTNVVYSKDGSTLTMYLDGQVPVSGQQSRAINRDIAMTGHDYFEVAFLHPATNTIARAAWSLGDQAVISNIYRDVDIDYGFVYNTGLTSLEGAAILFVGKKTDRTLLAIGRVASVDGAAVTTIGPSTTSITFSIDALKAGVVYPTEVSSGIWEASPNSSFLTAAKDSITPAPNQYTNISATNTEVVPFYIFGRPFPMFKLTEEYNGMRAQYTFGVTSLLGFEYYRGGIILAEQMYVEKKQPRYPIPGGGFQNFSLRLDNQTRITPINNLTAEVGTPIKNPLLFEFDTEMTVNASAFSLFFEIPVYPLSAAGNPGKWYVRPAYDSYAFDLDDGVGGAGGAVLIGTGTLENPPGYRIRVRIPPDKQFYNTGTGKDFDIRGLVVEMVDSNNNVVRIIRHHELHFILGGAELTPGTPSDPPGSPYTPGRDIHPELFGINMVLVNYRDPLTGIIYTDYFAILSESAWDNSGVDWSYIPASHFFSIRPMNQYNMLVDYPELENVTPWDNWIFYEIQDMIREGGPGTYIILVNSDFHLPELNLPTFGPVILMFIATNAGSLEGNAGGGWGNSRRIGKSSNNAIVNWHSNNVFYFGGWPFSNPINVTTESWPRSSNGIHRLTSDDYARIGGVFLSRKIATHGVIDSFGLNAAGVAYGSNEMHLSGAGNGDDPWGPYLDGTSYGNGNYNYSGGWDNRTDWPLPGPNNYFLRDGWGSASGGRVYNVFTDYNPTAGSFSSTSSHVFIANYNYLH